MRLPLSILAALAIAVTLSAPPASAAPAAPSFALVPQHYDPGLQATQSYFVAVAKPGETFTNSVRVRNLGNEAGTALLYPVDATTGQTSGAVYLDRSKHRRGVGGWVELGAKSVTLAPGESRVVPVTVHVPAGAAPGDHLAGIVAENAQVQSSTGKGALQIKVRHLTIAAVEVQVPGKSVARVGIGGVRAGGEHGYQYVYVRIKSTGALTTRPTGRILIADGTGKQVAVESFTMDTVLPGTSIDYPVLLPRKVLAPGEYRATVQVTYDATAIGYRRTPGPSREISRTFGFGVSAAAHASIFKGTASVRGSASPTRSGGNTYLLWLAVGLTALVVGLFGLLVVLLRRA